MPAIPTKLCEAFEKIRLGKVDDGVRLFDRVDGFEPIKSVALAELAYFRHDWKHAILFDRDFFDSSIVIDSERRYSDCISSLHLELMLVATCCLECWNETRKYFEQLKKRHLDDMDQRNDWYSLHHDLPKMISLVSDPENTRHLILESKPKPRTEGKVDLEQLQRKAERTRPEHARKHWRATSYDRLVDEAALKATTEDHIAFYEHYLERFESAEIHAKAACSYIAMEDLPRAREAVRRYMICWKYKESVQVAPVILFTEHELWPILSDRRFTESLLSIPHNREA